MTTNSVSTMHLHGEYSFSFINAGNELINICIFSNCDGENHAEVYKFQINTIIIYKVFF